TPYAYFTGADTFTYAASDGLAGSAPTAVTITVSNQAPAAVDDAYEVLHGHALVTYAGQAPAGVLDKDTDAEGDPLTASVVSYPTHGTLSAFDGSGAFTYTP